MTVLENIDQMKRMAEILIKHSFPTVSAVDEDIISPLKQRVLVVDGYEITVYYSICKYRKDLILKTVQIYSRNMTYLPFRLLCKIAKLFFGETFPSFSYVDDYRFPDSAEARKVYVWSIYCDEDKIISFEENPIFSNLKLSQFENFCYYSVNGNHLKFF